MQDTLTYHPDLHVMQTNTIPYPKTYQHSTVMYSSKRNKYVYIFGLSFSPFFVLLAFLTICSLFFRFFSFFEFLIF